jgi:hypothetical protein
MDYDLDVTADKLAERLEQEVRPYQRKAANQPNDNQ